MIVSRRGYKTGHRRDAEKQSLFTHRSYRDRLTTQNEGLHGTNAKGANSLSRWEAKRERGSMDKYFFYWGQGEIHTKRYKGFHLHIWLLLGHSHKRVGRGTCGRADIFTLVHLITGARYLQSIYRDIEASGKKRGGKYEVLEIYNTFSMLGTYPQWLEKTDIWPIDKDHKQMEGHSRKGKPFYPSAMCKLEEATLEGSKPHYWRYSSRWPWQSPVRKLLHRVMQPMEVMSCVQCYQCDQAKAQLIWGRHTQVEEMKVKLYWFDTIILSKVFSSCF